MKQKEGEDNHLHAKASLGTIATDSPFTLPVTSISKISGIGLNGIESKIKNKSLTPESKLISDNFAKNKSLLPWPTQEGTIAVNFGERPHPIMPGIKIMNNGIEIATSSNRVRSVFEGEVSKVLVLPNSLKVIILRHGEYFTVYSNLYEVFVDIGDKVSTKQNIGDYEYKYVN